VKDPRAQAKPGFSSAPLVAPAPAAPLEPEPVTEPIDPHIDGFRPIGWNEEFQSGDFSFSRIRAEIVVEAPIGVEWPHLAVVDPDNLSGKGFPFVAVPGSEANGKRLLMAVPIFTVLSGSSEITYALRLRQSE
jgi:hypothetical protein